MHCERTSECPFRAVRFRFVCAGRLGQAPAMTPAKTPSPELVGMLTKDLNVTPKQATGGAGRSSAWRKAVLKPDQFSQVAAAVPGMDGLLKAAPSAGGLAGLGSGVPGAAGGQTPRRCVFPKAWPLP